MKARWVMGIGGLAVVLLIVGGTAIGAANAARSSPSTTAQEGTVALQEEPGKPWLGISVVQTPDGVAVNAVIADSPADGVLERGDILTAVDGTSVTNLRELREQLQGMAVGTAISLTIERDGQTLNVSVTPAERPEPLVQKPHPFPELQGIPKEERFSHILGGQFNLTDADGNPLTVTLTPGTVVETTDTSITIDTNAGGNQTYQVTENTLGRMLLDRLESGAKVTVVTVNNGTEARMILPGAVMRHFLPVPKGKGHHRGHFGQLPLAAPSADTASEQ